MATVGVLPAVPAAEGQEPMSIESLGWMAGCWEGRLDGGSLYEEVWLAPRGGVMVGVSRTLRDEKAVGHEFLRIAEEDGALIYLADPSGQMPTRFAATEIGDGAVTFANPEHDFPQRILYRLQPPDSLLARIEGERQGRMHGADFQLRRVSCPQGNPGG
ncbi:MAG: DUF6265 family protein, partial [Thermoanaerobaculia bacterium]